MVGWAVAPVTNLPTSKTAANLLDYSGQGMPAPNGSMNKLTWRTHINMDKVYGF
jgi:hypothetical protein